MGKSKHVAQYRFDEILGVKVEGIDVVIDTREKSKYKTAFINRLIELLEHFGYTWTKTKLPAGDYLINRGRGLGIERKTVGDLIGTAYGQREDGNALESELKKLVDPEIYGGTQIPTCLCCENGRTISMKEEYKKEIVEKTRYGKPITVTEYNVIRYFTYKDHRGKRRKTRLYPNSWISITQKIQYYTQYFEFVGVDHFVSWVISKIKKEIKYEKDKAKGEEDIKQLRMSNKINKLTMSEQQQYIIEGIPDIGPKISVRGLEYYSTLRLFFLNVKKPEDLIQFGASEPASTYALKLLDHPFDKNEKTKKKKRKKRKKTKKESEDTQENQKKTDLMIQYEKENEGKKAMWGGNPTKGFLQWKDKKQTDLLVCK